MKRLTIVMLSVLCVIVFQSCNDEDNPVKTNDYSRPENNMFFSESDEVKEVKPWTFMFYNDADFDPGYDPAQDFSNAMYSTNNVNVIMLHDTYIGGTKLEYVSSAGYAQEVVDAGEVNMGDQATLDQFIAYCKYVYPAERYIISFYDHGAGWAGACVDETNNDDMLRMNEMCNAFTNNGGIDVTMFSAPCLMASIESLYELKGCTRAYIGSENLSGYMLWIYSMGDIRALLTSDPAITNEDLTSNIIDYIEENISMWTGYDLSSITMSALNTNGITDLKSTFSEITSYYLSNPQKFSSIMSLIQNNVTCFHNYSVDLYDLFSRFRTYEENSDIKIKIDRLLDQIEGIVEAEYHGSEISVAKGASIYFPIGSQFNTQYLSGNTSLSWTSETRWDELISNYFAGLGTVTNSSLAIPPHIDANILRN